MAHTGSLRVRWCKQTKLAPPYHRLSYGSFQFEKFVILCGFYIVNCHHRKTISPLLGEKKLGLLSPWWRISSFTLAASSWRTHKAAGSTAARSCAWRKIMRTLAEWRQFEWGNTQIKLMKRESKELKWMVYIKLCFFQDKKREDEVLVIK